VLDASHTADSAAAPRILIANDQEWTARSLESILASEGYEVIRAYTGRQAHDRAREAQPDLIILDVQLPDISGPDVCRRLREDARVGVGTPIILTTAGSTGRSRQTECLQAGAWDFAAQPFDGPLLLLMIRPFLQAKATLDAARCAALVDSVTGLYNRLGLALKLEELTAAARRRREPVTCMVVSAGSPDLVEAVEAGEEVSRLVARAIRAGVRGSDLVARLSPLNFAIVAPTLNRDLALHLVDRFQNALTNGRPPGAPTVQLRVGIAVIDETDEFDAGDLLRRAGAALECATAERPGSIPG
jgi:two-component system cell cycle response regulator